MNVYICVHIFTYVCIQKHMFICTLVIRFCVMYEVQNGRNVCTNVLRHAVFRF